MLEAQNTALHDIAFGIIRENKHHRTPAFLPFLLALLPWVTPLWEQMFLSPTPQKRPTHGITVAVVCPQLVRLLARTPPPNTRNPHRVEGCRKIFAVRTLSFRENTRKRAGFAVRAPMQFGGQSSPTAPPRFGIETRRLLIRRLWRLA